MALVSNIKPQTMDKKAANIITTLTIKVGKRGTNPVFRNSVKTGKNSSIEINPKIIANETKNFKGFFCKKIFNYFSLSFGLDLSNIIFSFFQN